ncbi:hypothetical protein FB567DRAFT_598399 [Paraphoma chrysanthemicola]|uniref:Uncharacterized protein n=1 Tax=Paraphoma chrysanthemicola TaxID=798071 RepID=A0A8K0VSG2_9PLEO|nr:hypothetical protein FB567DRAFT_598399 [Paraphoma chrysanthemicola]
MSAPTCRAELAEGKPCHHAAAYASAPGNAHDPCSANFSAATSPSEAPRSDTDRSSPGQESRNSTQTSNEEAPANHPYATVDLDAVLRQRHSLPPRQHGGRGINRDASGRILCLSTDNTAAHLRALLQCQDMEPLLQEVTQQSTQEENRTLGLAVTTSLARQDSSEEAISLLCNHVNALQATCFVLLDEIRELRSGRREATKYWLKDRVDTSNKHNPIQSATSCELTGRERRKRVMTLYGGGIVVDEEADDVHAIWAGDEEDDEQEKDAIR